LWQQRAQLGGYDGSGGIDRPNLAKRIEVSLPLQREMCSLSGRGPLQEQGVAPYPFHYSNRRNMHGMPPQISGEPMPDCRVS
jgi:hypothetical protein